MEIIESKILHYLNYLQDVDYLAEIVNSVSDTELCNIINEFLQSEDDEIIGSTCLFIRDLLVLGSRPHNREKFVKGYPESLIVKNLEQLLFYPNHFTRKQVVYTLGKACSYSSISVLNQAFNIFRDTDPILLPRLIGEMGWLGAENFWALLDSMMSSQVYMTRWAVVDVLSEFVGDDMLFILHKRNHPELTYFDGQEPIIHLEADFYAAVNWANTAGVRWAFSNGNAGAYITNFYKRAADIIHLDWSAIQSTDFRDPKIKEGKQAEFLMFDIFPWTLVEKIGTINNTMELKVQATLASAGHQPQIVVEPTWYF